MLKKRVIPVLLLKNGLLVRSERFKTHQIIGNPINEAQRFNEWNVDELIYLDITRDDSYASIRQDHKISGLNNPWAVLDAVSLTCFMPLTWGGGIRMIDDMRQRFNRGADKIVINTQAVRSPETVTEAAKKFGSQAIVVCIDVLRKNNGDAEVFIDSGRTATGLSPEKWVKKVCDLGAGEILLQSIDRDGMATGYDLDLIKSVSKVVTIPVIALGGVGDYNDYVKGIEAGASAVAAANIWHFKELSDKGSKRIMAKKGIEVRLEGVV